MGAYKRIGISKQERAIFRKYSRRFNLLDCSIEISRDSGKRSLYLIGTDTNDIDYRIRFDKVKKMRRFKGNQVTSKKKYFVYQANKVHGEDTYGYDLINEDEMYYKDKLSIVCPEHGVFKKTKTAFITAKEGCPMCSRNRLNNNRQYFKKDELR